MNEWVGADINVVGPLQIPPGDEFSIPESSHLFGKSAWQKAAHRKMKQDYRGGHYHVDDGIASALNTAEANRKQEITSTTLNHNKQKKGPVIA